MFRQYNKDTGIWEYVSGGIKFDTKYTTKKSDKKPNVKKSKIRALRGMQNG